MLALLTLRAGLAMWRGRHAEARDAVRQGLAETRSDDVLLLAVLAWHGLRAEAEAYAGRAVPVDSAAVAHLREVVALVGRRSATAAGPVREAVAGYQELCNAELGRLAGRSDADAWAGAATLWQRRNHPYPVACARLRQAEALFAQRTRNAAAGTVLRDAYQLAISLGARPLSAEIKALAARARVPLEDRGQVTAKPAPAAPPGPVQRRGADPLATLTAREVEVLHGVAEGLTNREIARRLFISERTIGVHVSHILDKLQVRSRVQASAMYLRAAAGHRPPP